MESFIQALIVSFREGLEAFLIIALLLAFLDRTKNSSLKGSVWTGAIAGIIVSLGIGLVLTGISSLVGGTGTSAKLWESIASLAALALITTFIVWMIKNGSNIRQHIENAAAMNLSKTGIFLIALVMVAREGAEIVIFQFAGKYAVAPMIAGIAIALLLATLIHYSLVKIKLQTIFNITLFYLILQAGFLLGYGIHEGLSASNELGIVGKDNSIFAKAFDLSKTAFSHKEGIIGIPLYIAAGWHSSPEWIQFLAQYAYTGLLLFYWHSRRKAAGQ